MACCGLALDGTTPCCQRGSEQQIAPCAQRWPDPGVPISPLTAHGPAADLAGMDFGRIHTVLIATKAGEVVYERYYDRYTELDKAEIRSAFQQATETVNLASDGMDFVGSFK